MKTEISIGGIRFCIRSEETIRTEGPVSQFLSTGTDSDPVNIRVIHSASAAPKPAGPMSGEDLLLEHYVEEDRILTLAKGGAAGYLSTVVSDREHSDITCYLNTAQEDGLDSLSELLRLMPMCRILQQKGAMFFHAAQIGTMGKGILFTAPSGTGKTTQAKLWNKYRNADILCNDRTLVRDGRTYGYPVDGSEPVCSPRSLPLGAVVILEQAPQDRIRRARVREALARLMPLLVIDRWDPEAAALAAEQILALIQQIPVYVFGCTPEESAVICLEERLQKDGVL